MRVTWRERRSGRQIGNFDVNLDGVRIGGIQYKPGHGWFWNVRDDEHGIDLQNTCRSPVRTVQEVKADCTTYVKGCLSEKK